MWELVHQQRVRWTLVLTLFAFSGTACTKKKQVDLDASCASRVAVTYTGSSEASYCSTITTYPSPVSVSGTATYGARTTGVGGLVNTTTRPIRYAEVEIVDSSGARIQCGETDANGDFDLDVPQDAGTLTIKVNSRSARLPTFVTPNVNSNVHASILNCPEENRYYSLATTFTAAAAPVAIPVPFKAEYNIDFLGGAFNIYDQFLNANVFLRSKVGACAFAGCDTVDVAPKVQAYWVPGFNPNIYFGDSDSGLSFYLPGYSRLFILGGIDGDTDSEDTDHFDNSVVLHEYGHFLEDVYSNTDSPGGQHSGNKLIDPRLAWSEGWGNFVQAAISNDPFYRDTRGNPDGTTFGYIFSIPLETTPGACGGAPNTPGCDVPVFTDEGNFREFSVARLLWDAHDGGGGGTDTDGDVVTNAFAQIWASITAPTGFMNTLEEFRAIGFLHEVQSGLGAGSWATIRTSHKHGDTTEYAQYLTAQGGGCGLYPFAMDPYDDSNDDGSFSTSHLLRNNDFYYYKHGGGTLTVTLNYLTDPGGDADYNDGELESDMDLFVYSATARYGNSNDMKLVAQEYFDNNPASAEQETATRSLPSGNYLINVKIYTDEYTGSTPLGTLDPGELINAGTPLNYNLKTNGGVALCPSARP